MISVGLVLVFTATRLVTQGYNDATFSGNMLYWLFVFVVTQVLEPPYTFVVAMLANLPCFRRLTTRPCSRFY